MKKYVYVLMAGYWIGNFLFNPGAFGSPAKLNYFHHLGKMSYGMYMLNPIIVAIVIKSFHKYNWEGMFFYMFLIHAGVFIAINLSYYLIELPFLKAKERFAVVKSGGELKRLLDEPMFGPFAKKV
jgi:peptidoglycan/LPS O-acetylase OafA/YrhL